MRMKSSAAGEYERALDEFAYTLTENLPRVRRRTHGGTVVEREMTLEEVVLCTGINPRSITFADGLTAYSIVRGKARKSIVKGMVNMVPPPLSRDVARALIFGEGSAAVHPPLVRRCKV